MEDSTIAVVMLKKKLI